MGSSKILHMVDYLLESMFLTTDWHTSCCHEQPSEVDSETDEILTLSLEQFQLAALCVFYVVATTWVCCTNSLIRRIQASGQTVLRKSDGVHTTPVLRVVDSPTSRRAHSLSSKLTRSLLHLLHKFDRFRVWPRSEKTPRAASIESVKFSSPSASVTTVKLSPGPDRRSSRAFTSATELSPRPGFRLDTGTSLRGNCQSEIAFIGSLVKPRRHINSGLRSWVERYNHIKDCIDACDEPHCDWTDGIDACDEPHSDWKESIESFVKHKCNWEKGIEYLAEHNCCMEEERDSWFQNREYRTSGKLLAKAPSSGLARSSRNTDTSRASGMSRKKQSPKVEMTRYFSGKRVRLIKERLTDNYYYVNSDEAVSDLLHGDLGSILNKYYKDPCTGISEIEQLKVRRKITAPSSEHIQEEGFSVLTAPTGKALSINTSPNSTPERRKCLFTTTICSNCQNKKIRKRKKETRGILEKSSKQKKRSQRSNMSTVSSKSSVLTSHRAKNTVFVKPVNPPPPKITPKAHESSKENHVTRRSKKLLQGKKQNDTDLEFVNYDQHSILPCQGQLLTGHSAVRITEGCAQTGSQKSYSSDNLQGHNLSNIFPSLSTEAVINSLPHTEEFLSSSGHYSGINGIVFAASSSKETFSEMTGSCSKSNKSYEDKRSSKPLMVIKSVKSLCMSGAWRSLAVRSDESDFLGRTPSEAERDVCPLAPNTVFSNSRIKCQVSSKIQSPRIRNFKESCKREVGSKIKRTSTKSIAVQSDMCSTNHKLFTAQQASIKHPLSCQQQDQKTESIFQCGNVHPPQASNFVYGNRLIRGEPLASMRQVLSKAAIMTSSSNYDTDKQSVLSQADAISWSMNVQSRSSKRDVSQDAQKKAKKNRFAPTSDIHLQQDTQHTLASEGWTKLAFANSSKMFEYKTEPKQPHKDYLNSGHEDNATDPKVQKRVQNEIPMPTTRPFDGHVCITEKATLNDAQQVDANPQQKELKDYAPRQELLSTRPNTAITRDASKRRSLIPRHINTLSKINRAKQDTREHVPCPANTLGRYPANTQGTYPANTTGSYPANTLGTHPSNAMGTYPSNTMSTYLSNTIGTCPANATGSYPANTMGTYPSNTIGTYPSKTMGSYPSNTMGTYPSNTVRSYPSNTMGTHLSNTMGTYPSNTICTHLSNTMGTYPSNTMGTYPSNKMGTYTSNTMGGDVNSMASRVFKNACYRSAFKSATTEKHPTGEMANDKPRQRTLVSENVKSGKQKPYEVITAKKQTQFRQIRREKQCLPQTQKMIANTPTVPKRSIGRLHRWTRSVIKDTQDQCIPGAKCSEKKELSNVMKIPGLATRDPKLGLMHAESMIRANAKSGTTTSENAQNKQIDANHEMKPTSIANKEKGGFAGVNKGNEKEQNVHTQSKDSHEHKESDKEVCTGEGSDHAQADAFSWHSPSEEISLLTLTTLNYRLMSNSPIPQRTNEDDVQKRSSFETEKGNTGNRYNCGILENSTNEQHTLGSKPEVLTNKAFKLLSGTRSRSERITQSEATSIQRTQEKRALKSFKSATDNATGGSQTHESVDLPGEVDCRGTRSLRRNIDTKCGNIKTTQGVATSTLNDQSTHDLKSFICTLDNADQCCHIGRSTDLNDVNNDYGKVVRSVKNISTTDSADTTITKTVPSKQLFRPACKENAGERCETVRPYLTARKTSRSHSSKVWSELDCNKSNTTENITDKRRWHGGFKREVGGNTAGCSEAVKQKLIDASRKYSKDERCLKPRCYRTCKLPCMVYTPNAVEDPLLHLPSGICAARENKHTIHLRNSRCNEVLAGTEQPQIDEVTSIRSSTPHLQLSYDTKHIQERTEIVKGITEETFENQLLGNACLKYKGTRNTFEVNNNDKQADPVVDSRAGRTFKLSTRFYTKDNKLPVHCNYTTVKTLHGNCVNKVIEEHAKQKYTQDGPKRVHCMLKDTATRKLAFKQSGISKARIKHPLTKTANTEQMKAENKYPNTINKTSRPKTYLSENNCRQNNKTARVKNCTQVWTGNTAGNRVLQNETMIRCINDSRQMKSQWLEDGRPVLSQNQCNGSKSGLESSLGYTQLRRIQTEGNENDFSNIKTQEFASMKSTSRMNVFLNQDDIIILNSNRHAADGLLVHNVNEWDTTGFHRATEQQGVAQYNLTGQRGYAIASGEMPVHKREEMPVHESENTSFQKSEEMPVDESEEMPDHESEEMPDHESEEMPDHGSEEMSDHESEEMPDHESEEIPVDASEEMPDHESEEKLVHEGEEMPIHDITLSLHNNNPHRSKVSVCQKTRSYSGSLRTSQSMSSAEVGAATYVCCPLRSICSVLKVNQLNSVAEIESQGSTWWRRRALVGSARDCIHASDIVKKSSNNCQKYHGTAQVQQFPNMPGHEEFIKATFCSDFSDKYVHKEPGIVNSDTIKHLPSNTELRVMPGYVSNASEDFAYETLECSVRFNQNEGDNEKVFHEHGPYNIQEVSDKCCSKARCPDDNSCVTDLIICPGCCKFGRTLKTDSKLCEYDTRFLRSLQAQVNTKVQEKGEHVATLEGDQVTASKSQLLFSLNRTLDCTHTDIDSNDSSSLSSTTKEHSSHTHDYSPTESESVNYWSRDSQSTYLYSSSQESECKSHHTNSNNYDYYSMGRFATKHESKSHYHLIKENKSNSQHQFLTKCEFNSHKQGPRLINSRSLKPAKSQSSSDARKVEMTSSEDRKRKYVDQGQQPKEQSASVSMHVDKKRVIQLTALVQGDSDRQSALACLWTHDGYASPRLQNMPSNQVTYLPANLGQQFHEDEDIDVQRQELSLREGHGNSDKNRLNSLQRPFESISLNSPVSSAVIHRINRGNRRTTQQYACQYTQSQEETDIQTLTSKSLQLISKKSDTCLRCNSDVKNRNADLEDNKQTTNIRHWLVDQVGGHP